jgi:hypothetical protein
MQKQLSRQELAKQRAAVESGGFEMNSRTEQPFFRNQLSGARTVWLPVVAMLVVILVLTPGIGVALPAQAAQVPVVLRGSLNGLPGNQPTLETGEKSYKLVGQSPYILRTLQDKRLLHQELQLVGIVGPNGDFVVQRFYAVHNGKLYKIEYYCEVCNITYVQPGHCVCCGRETKLKEVPVAQTQ